MEKKTDYSEQIAREGQTSQKQQPKLPWYMRLRRIFPGLESSTPRSAGFDLETFLESSR